MGELVKCLGIARHCIATVSHWFHFFTVHLFLTAAVPLVFSSSHCSAIVEWIACGRKQGGDHCCSSHNAMMSENEHGGEKVVMMMVVKRW